MQLCIGQKMSKIVVFDAKVITFGINKEYFLAFTDME